jgi:hypothetical protein
MKRSRIVLLLGVCLAAALYFGISSTAHAGYGSPTAYQVEISANPPGEGLWFWSALDTGGGGGDYQETDCVHVPGLHAAAHDAGEVHDWWIDTATNTLHIDGVLLVGGAETANLVVPLPAGGGFGHVSGSIEVDFAGVGIPIITGTFGNAQIQIAP